MTTAAAFGFAGSAADAAVGSMTVSLSIGPPSAGCAANRELVSGVVLVRMPQSEALVDIQRYRIILDGWGDDDWTRGGDDHEFGPFNASARNVVPSGLEFRYSTCVLDSDLNEDSGEGDEIFVKVRLIDNNSGSVIRNVNSPTVHGRW